MVCDHGTIMTMDEMAVSKFKATVAVRTVTERDTWLGAMPGRVLERERP